MKINSVSSEDKRLARLGGFRKKAPVKPKNRNNSNTLKNYIERYNGWAKDLKKAANHGKELDGLKKEVTNAKR